MKSITELDHYELLDVSRDASREEIERAYRVAGATWEQGSLATYSLYSDAEAEALRERIEYAYGVLADVDARAAYDAGLTGRAGEREAERIPLDLELTFEEPPRAELLPAGLEFEESPEEHGAPFDGARLRRSRLQRGIDLDQIAQVTKVNPTYLRFIEEDHFEHLPASVYVRGFVTAYARCLGLDPARVVPDYMERFEAARPQREAIATTGVRPSLRSAGGRRSRR
jgi:flagellar biosynthesis protein FlhG